MATINLGSIKFKWQGAYAGGTAYTVDDVVSYNGSSYICILASTGNLPTNATYWEQMSAKGTDGTNGTDGTDLTSTLTTQGDLIYRDGSGLQRLGAGTSGQVLQTGGTGANPSWVDSSGGILQVVSTEKTDTGSWTTSATRVDTGLQAIITPSSTSSKILMLWQLALGYQGTTAQDFIHLDRNGTEINLGDAGSGQKRANSQWGGSFSGNSDEYMVHTYTGSFLDAPNSTSALTYKVQSSQIGSSNTHYINRSDRDGTYTAYDGRFVSNIILLE